MGDTKVGWTTRGIDALGWGQLLSPIQRRLTRTHVLLWTVILGATTVDTVSTLVGLTLGLTEGNPVVVTMVEAFGPAGLLLVKIPALLTVGVGWLALSKRNGAIALGLFGTVTSLVVANNLAAIIIETGL